MKAGDLKIGDRVVKNKNGNSIGSGHLGTVVDISLYSSRDNINEVEVKWDGHYQDERYLNDVLDLPFDLLDPKSDIDEWEHEFELADEVQDGEQKT